MIIIKVIGFINSISEMSKVKGGYRIIGENIVKATYTSVWDGGIEITTNCQVNLDTKEVLNIEVQNLPESMLNCLETLEREYITLGESEYEVRQSDGENTDEFRYK